MTGVPIKSRNWGTDAHRENAMWTHRPMHPEAKGCHMASGPLGAWAELGAASPHGPRRSHPALVLGLPPPELEGNTLLLLEPPKLWCFVTTALRKEYRATAGCVRSMGSCGRGESSFLTPALRPGRVLWMMVELCFLMPALSMAAETAAVLYRQPCVIVDWVISRALPRAASPS